MQADHFDVLMGPQRAAQPGGLSPRSQRLSVNIPKPHSQALAAIVKLENVRKQVKLTLEESRKVKEIVSSSLQRYFALLPDDKVNNQSCYMIDYCSYITCCSLTAF
jgi:hypothetical protein